MPAPAHIREALDDLERRYTGPVPADAHHEARRPRMDRFYPLVDVQETTEHFTAECRSAWLAVKATAHWAAKDRRDEGRDSIRAHVSMNRFDKAAARLKRARALRDDWGALLASVTQEVAAE